MITLKLGQTLLQLPEGLIWTNEFGWSPTVSSTRDGSTGALIVHVGKRKAGRPITLDGVLCKAWIERSVCQQLYAWEAIPDAVFELVLRGTARQVRFDNTQGAGFTAQPMWRLLDSEHNGQTDYYPILKFIEV